MAAAAIGFLLSAILALLIVVMRGSRARLPARRRDPAGSGHLAGGRPDPADWS